MNRSKSIQTLLNKSKKDFIGIKADYDVSLQHQSISEELKVDVKNIFENLRSCLDYMAHDIFEACIVGNTPERLYFPIRQSRREFDQAIGSDFPDLPSLQCDVYDLLEGIQPYNDDWLGKFNKLNNNNKHQDLEEQTKTEAQHVKVTSPRGLSVSWGPGANFGSGVSILGARIDPTTQMPVANSQVKTEVTIWVDFKFKENGESVLPFLEKSISNIETLFSNLGKHI